VGTREKSATGGPFITSTLQQESSRKLRFSVKRTMALAQRLYEGVEIGAEGAVGLITYMRTDSTRVSDDAVSDARHYIAERYGRSSCRIRPTSTNPRRRAGCARGHPAHFHGVRAGNRREVPGRGRHETLPAHWNRFVACQMMPALFDQTTIDVAAKGTTEPTTCSAPPVRCSSSRFLKAYQEGKDQADEEDEELRHRLPAVAEGECLRFRAIKPEQHFTEPPRATTKPRW